MSKQLLLQTIDNYTNISKTSSTISLYTQPLFKNKKGKLKLESIRGVIENDILETDVDTTNLPRYQTFNVYLKSNNLLFGSSKRNEYLLNTYTLQLPRKMRYELQYRVWLGLTRWFWYKTSTITTPTTSGIDFYNQYVNSKFDQQYRFKIISGLAQYNGKTGYFNDWDDTGTYFAWRGVVLDDGTDVQNTLFDLQEPTIVEIWEYYSQFEPENVDDEFNQEIDYEKLDNMNTDFTIELRDLETNQVIDNIIDYEIQEVQNDPTYTITDTVQAYELGDTTAVNTNQLTLLNGLTVRQDAYNNNKPYLWFDTPVYNFPDTGAYPVATITDTNLLTNVKSILFWIRTRYSQPDPIQFLQVQYSNTNFFLQNINRAVDQDDENALRCFFDPESNYFVATNDDLMFQTLAKINDTTTTPNWNMVYFELFGNFKISINNDDRIDNSATYSNRGPAQNVVNNQSPQKIVIGACETSANVFVRNLGGDTNADPDLSRGGIRDFALFNRALTGQELTDLYNGTIQLTEITTSLTNVPVLSNDKYPDLNILLEVD